MDIDETIMHYEKKAKELRVTASLGLGNPDPYAMSPTQCIERAKDYEQLAEWLKELKAFKVLFDSVEDAKQVLNSLMT